MLGEENFNENKSKISITTGITSENIGFKDVDTFIQNGFETFKNAIRNANALPADRNYDFYQTHEAFKEALSGDSDHILTLINKILRNNDVEDNIKNRSFDDKFELIVEGNDCILERAATAIDDMNGLRQLPKVSVIQTVSAELPLNGSWNKLHKFKVNSALPTASLGTGKSISLLTATNIIRPQTFFKDKVDNSNQHPWKPRITEKPNSLKPLALYIEDSEHGDIYANPYEFELDRFVPSDSQLKKCTPVKPKPVADTPLYEVTTEEQLNDLLVELRKHSEIAVDLEHHSYRTFMGITCLMQISTKDADYIVDTLALRDKLHVLNEVFTRNSIVKVFHGADMDIQWLQRDLSLYVVNMFDTHKAAKQLGYSGLSLAYLMQRYCSIIPDKKFQLADWRIRPLPEELKAYAREDTHYLLYIYQMLKNELLKMANGQSNILKSVIESSTEVCKTCFVKQRLTETSHMNFYRKCKRLFDNRQMYALKELYAWRDVIARQEDESTGYVLPNHMLLQISEMLPREVQGILACCNPIPPLVRSNAIELHQIILKARDQPLDKPIMKEINRTKGSTKESAKINVDSPLHCPHDCTKLQEFRDDLPTLLSSNAMIKENILKVDQNCKLEMKHSSCSVFDSIDESNAINKPKLKFLGPYERYKLVKPYLDAKDEDSPKNATAEDPLVEDRIAALHTHFVKCQNDVQNKKETKVVESMHNKNRATPKTLLQMGGSRKRKREEESAPSALHNPAYELPENTLHTPLPLHKPPEKDSNWAPQQTPSNSHQKNKMNRKRSYEHRFNEQSGKKSRGDFKPYDYSQVDYGQFQGGSRPIKQPERQFQSKFRGKNKKNQGRNKFNNRSAVFNNAGGFRKQ